MSDTKFDDSEGKIMAVLQNDRVKDHVLQDMDCAIRALNALKDKIENGSGFIGYEGSFIDTVLDDIEEFVENEIKKKHPEYLLVVKNDLHSLP